ncbi:hypothetical protein [Candidatus Magnetominusculus dajiuhuensis]|uniref:hypothetical protein n=1 Tax=Candidatus Magnetominusculus dajiuhuensis TaxID=3137712 RepID=UPI003B42EA7E
MSAGTFEITLNELKIDKGTKASGGKITNVLAATLFYPSAGRGEVGTIKTITIETGTVSFTNSSFENKILFKEKISGNTQIKFKITQTIELTDMEKFVVKLLHNVFGAGAKVASEAILAGVTAGIGNVLIGAALNTSIDELLKKMFDEDYKQITILGEGSIYLKAANLAGATTTMEIVLRCPDDIIIATNRQTGGLESFSPTQAPRDSADNTLYDTAKEVIVNKGDPNGAIAIEITEV